MNISKVSQSKSVQILITLTLQTASPLKPHQDPGSEGLVLVLATAAGEVHDGGGDRQVPAMAG